jgi:hypothetical protein
MRRYFVTALACLLTACATSTNVVVDKPHAIALASQTTSAPQIFFTASGKLYALYGVASGNHNQLFLRVSGDGGDSFDKPTPVSPADASPMLHGEMSPQMVYDHRKQRIYVLYEEQSGNTDRLTVTGASVWSRKFGAPVEIVPKRIPSANSFAALGTAPNGDVDVAWLDGRIDQQNRPGTFALYVARSHDGGGSFSAPLAIAHSVCPCCRPSFAYDGKGGVYIAWRRVEQNNIRNVVVARSTQWPTFAAPVMVHNDDWKIDGCPDSGPRLLFQNDRLWVAWYTQGDNNVPEIRLSESDDGALSFAPYKLVSQGIDEPNHPAWIFGASTPMLVWQGRRSNAQGWETQSAFVSIIRNGAPGKPVSLSGKGSISDPVGASSDATNAFIAATQSPNTAVLIRLKIPNGS